MRRIDSPRLQQQGNVTQLIVNGKPFLMLGGELGNSTASHITEFSGICAKLKQMHLNTVLLPVYWDLVEPREGTFDFSLLQGAITMVRDQQLRIVLLWFGTWKNSMSCYAPGWVKRDTKRFTRVQRRSGKAIEIISPFCDAARDADALAFSRLMRWLKTADGAQETVLMLQVENEIGMIPEPRDYSHEAETAFQKAVPPALLSRLIAGEMGPEVTALWQRFGGRTDGTWSEVFGDEPEGEEVFSAWHFATFVEAVTTAGKQEYDLPMFVNAALIRPGYRPGQYPSAGPLPHLLEVWQASAPSLDMLCPDIYFPNFQEWSGRYVRGTNPLFIPEMAASARVCANALYAIGQLSAMGVAPFAIESTPQDAAIADCYRHLDGMSALILEAQRAGTICCLTPTVGFDWQVTDTVVRGEQSGIRFVATFDSTDGTGGDQTTVLPTLGAGRWDAPAGMPCGAALILQVAPEEYVILGSGVVLTFEPVDGIGSVGIESVREGWFSPDGIWHGRRWLNGDQTHQGRHLHFGAEGWQVQRVKLYRYS